MNEETQTTTQTLPPDIQGDSCPVCMRPAIDSALAAADRWCENGHHWHWIRRPNGWYKVAEQ